MDKLKVNKSEIKEYHKFKTISELTPLKEHVKILEQKKGCNFQEFEKRIKSQPESFSDWDDYIEWKAYQAKIDDGKKKMEI